MSDRTNVYHDPISGMDYADLPNSELGLARFTNGNVYIGRLYEPGTRLHRVTNPDYEYAETIGAFRDLAQRFHEDSTQ